MNMRYFTLTCPDVDFTGKIGGVSYADGKARVSFDDERDERGVAVAEELQVSTGRSAVLFARRHAARGYTVTETDAAGVPLPTVEETEAAAKQAKADAAATRKAAADKKAAEDAAKKDGAK